MKKADLVQQIAAQTGWNKSDAAKALDAVTECIQGCLKSGEEVALKGFGTFRVKEIPAHKGRNPATGETLDIMAKTKVSFKPSKEII